ncbi:MAG: TetR/AcrR family transcriptional regulator [Acidimicrobiia bacterium]|nr:TetR/AcrR family transcriptional regulator [Acidimicrobiia bacterium]
MSSIAEEETGTGRATLYKYFSDVESILAAWHERQIALHLRELTGIRDRAVDARERLEGVLSAYASIQHHLRSAHATELAAHIHRGDQVAHGQRVMQGLVRDLVAEAAKAGAVRDDVAPDELATYCLHALSAARDLPT